MMFEVLGVLRHMSELFVDISNIVRRECPKDLGVKPAIQCLVYRHSEGTQGRRDRE